MGKSVTKSTLEVNDLEEKLGTGKTNRVYDKTTLHKASDIKSGNETGSRMTQVYVQLVLAIARI